MFAYIGSDVDQIDATHYVYYVTVQNKIDEPVVIYNSWGNIKDLQGTLLASGTLEGTPITVEPQETVTLVVPVFDQLSLEKVQGKYDEYSIFRVNFYLEYRKGEGRLRKERVSLSLSKARLEQAIADYENYF
jgi:hypothetical protein